MLDTPTSTPLEPLLRVRPYYIGWPKVIPEALFTFFPDASSDFSNVVTIHIEIKPDRKTFILHSHALRSSSNPFAVSIDGQSAVVKDDKPISLPDLGAEDFTVYAKFLYTGLIFTKDAKVAHQVPAFIQDGAAAGSHGFSRRYS
ncbi:hypothetical protein SVAN01_08748 [Stagonosporopsis vannaccii]|nr:hypothetical protein SVAN01_08748 [Stagonosporopsis vannaccii]